MKTRNTITKLITMVMTMAVLCGAVLLPPVKAQTGDGSVRFVSNASIGIVYGEKIRLSVANTEASGGTLSLSFSYYLAHGTNAANSVPLYESEWIKVPAKEFRFSDVAREELNTEGELRTGRAQLLLKLTMIAPAGSDADDFPASLQIIRDEARDGETVKPDSKYRLIILAAKRSKQTNAPIGLNPGERLRYSFYYPNEEGDQPVRVTIYVYDSYGNLLKQTDPVVLRPGDGHIVDINCDDLRMPGEGRFQVRAGVQVALMDGSVRTIRLHGSMELVNDQTGSTAGGPYGGDYYTGSVTVSGDGF